MGGTPALTDQQANQRAGTQAGAGGSQQTSQQEQAVSPTVEQIAGPNEAAVATQQAQTEQPNQYTLRDVLAQEDMAFWSMLMFGAAVATVIVAAIGTILIKHQVKLTREAVTDTGKATVAMEKANRLADDIAKRQLRAYMGINKYDLSPYELGVADSGRFMVAMQNFGQTPAIALTTQVSYAITQWVDKDTRPEAWDYESGRLAIDVAPGAPMFRTINFSEHALAHVVGLDTGASVIWVKFHASYEDIFGRQHEQTTLFYSRRTAYRSGTMLPCDQTRETTTNPKRQRARKG